MGRRPKKFEQMKKKLDGLLFRMMAVSTGYNENGEFEWVEAPLNENTFAPFNVKKYSMDKERIENMDPKVKLYHENETHKSIASSILEYCRDLQNDFTPEERWIVIQMFKKN